MKLIIAFILTFFTYSAIAFDGKGKPIQVIMSFPQGGGVDETFRHLQKYSFDNGINFVGVYKPGGEGILSINELKNSQKDGYAVMITTAGVLANYILKTQNTDIVPLTVIKISNMSIISKKNSWLKDFESFEKTLKTPNTLLKVGIGAVNQKMVLDQIVKNTDVKATIIEVPYKGTTPAINDMLGGHIDIVIAPLSVTKTQVDNGNANLIATSSKITNTAALVEKIPNFKINEGFIFAVHKDVSKASLNFYNDLLKNYLNNEDVKKDIINSQSTITEFGPNRANSIIQNAIQALN